MLPFISGKYDIRNCGAWSERSSIRSLNFVHFVLLAQLVIGTDLNLSPSEFMFLSFNEQRRIIIPRLCQLNESDATEAIF